MEQELEVKILNEDIEKIKERAISLGAVEIAHEKQINTVIDSAESDEVLRSDAAILLSELQNLLTISQAVDKADGEINHAGLSELTGVAAAEPALPAKK